MGRQHHDTGHRKRLAREREQQHATEGKTSPASLAADLVRRGLATASILDTTHGNTRRKEHTT